MADGAKAAWRKANPGFEPIDPNRSRQGKPLEIYLRIKDPLDALDNPGRGVTAGAWSRIRHEAMRALQLIEERKFAMLTKEVDSAPKARNVVHLFYA